MTRLQEVEKLLDNNLQLITDYTKRAAELIGSVRQLEKERDKLTKKNRGLEVVRSLWDIPSITTEKGARTMSEKRWTIGRPINGVSLNGLEYLCDNAGRQLMYDSEESARADLRRYGYSDKRIEDEGIVICCFNEVDYMASLEKRNEELEAKVAELEGKHWNECRQIAHYSDELRRTKELLKAAVEDIRYLINHAKWNGKACDRCKYGNELYCYADDCSNDAKWQHEAEALALIGEDTNVPASADDTNVGHKSGDWISVNDRLPEIGKSVLVIVSINAKVNLPLCTDLALEMRIGWLDDNGKWGLQFDSADRDEILYWQPLPEPPKDGDTNG